LKFAFQHFVQQKVKEVEVDNPMKVNDLLIILYMCKVENKDFVERTATIIKKEIA
jgi:hypothetical protein